MKVQDMVLLISRGYRDRIPASGVGERRSHGLKKSLIPCKFSTMTNFTASSAAEPEPSAVNLLYEYQPLSQASATDCKNPEYLGFRGRLPELALAADCVQKRCGLR